MNTSPRYIAMRILLKVEEEGGYSNLALSHEMRNASFSELDKGFLTELVYGVIERKMTLDYFIARFSSVPIRKMNRYVLVILRIATYQLAYLDKVPSYSVCDEAVKIAKKVIPVNAGFINAVLRAMSQAKLVIPAYSKKLFHQYNRYLSVKHSMPEWLIARWLTVFGQPFVEALFESSHRHATFELRANTTKITCDALRALLEENGYEVQKSLIAKDGLRIANPAGIIQTKAFQQGLFYVQDAAASLVSHVLNPTKNSRILDACSAPGGKATHLAELMEDAGEVIACDVFPHKLGLINENLMRLSLNSVHPTLQDSTIRNATYDSAFDAVLLDVPCTGLGLLGRKPEIRWAREEQDFASLHRVQNDLLHTCAEYVKPGGTLVYSTCSIDPSENQERIHAFLSAHKAFSLCDFDALLPEQLRNRGGQDGMLTLYPQIDDCDGFFISKMRRVSS